ncbi:MAG: ATP-dependent DNA helicase RecG [Patescibacteria group bacterium]|nr:ATP-dependent DNA helicase RecG [Patescibacteria group bacterium]
MRELPLTTPLFEILGARAPLLRRFEKIGIRTAGDLLRHFPSRYEDFSKIYPIAELEPGQQATIQAAIEEIKLRRTRRGFAVVEAELSDESGTIRAIWFNQPYIANTLRAGRIANFSGKVSLSEESELYFNGPAYEILKPDKEGRSTESTHTARLVPVYPETKGLTSRGIRYAVRMVLKRNPEFKEWIPAPVLARYGLPEVHKAVQAVHFPGHLEDALAAQKRFAFENLFLLQLFNVEQKLKLSRETAPAIPVDIGQVKAILAELPFELTPSQKKSLWEIIQDLEKTLPMNRLLQGDVGSGKTIVAAMAAILAAARGYQAAFMAPTEILARQHFETLKKLFGSIASAEQPAFGLLTSGGAKMVYENDLEANIKKPEFQKKVAKGEIKIVIGTHALIQEAVTFNNLGLIIVDEQHRFGVRQRAALLRERGAGGRSPGKLIPHFLSMSATPIPRTLMLTVFGDLDLSLITELPSGRKPIETRIIAPLERQKAYDFVRSEIEAGRQAFVICPRIEEQTPASDIRQTSDAGTATLRLGNQLDLKSVKAEYEKLSKKIFPDLNIAMLHGQMKPREKETVMREFKDKKSDILVATSVVEVGVDVPNATVMMIEGADRFGLAQLYQFRGRVGRGTHQSYCLLMSEKPGEMAEQRLQAILKAKNGFELAEYDLKLRGPGEFFGTVQTGFPDELMQALQNPDLVKESREAAAAIVKPDPLLRQNAALREKLSEFRKKVHQE